MEVLVEEQRLTRGYCEENHSVEVAFPGLVTTRSILIFYV